MAWCRLLWSVGAGDVLGVVLDEHGQVIDVCVSSVRNIEADRCLELALAHDEPAQVVTDPAPALLMCEGSAPDRVHDM